MRITSASFDVVGLVVSILAVLLIVGVLPLTAASVGVILLLAQCEMSFDLSR